NLEEALEWAQKGLKSAEAYSLVPDLGWACLEMGCIYQARDETEQAIEWFTKSADYFQHYSYFYKLTIDHLSKINHSANQKNNRNSSDHPPGRHQDLIRGSHHQIQHQSQFSEQEKGIVLQMLGPLRIKRDGNELTIPRKSSLLLLLCLAVNYGKKLPKDQILEDLFPSGEYLAQNNRFYVSLSTLRKTLEPDLQ